MVSSVRGSTRKGREGGERNGETGEGGRNVYRIRAVIFSFSGGSFAFFLWTTARFNRVVLVSCRSRPRFKTTLYMICALYKSELLC